MNSGDGLTIFLFLIGGAAVVAALIYQYKKAQKRRADILQLSTQLDWTFLDKDQSAVFPILQMCESFTRGHSRYAYNCCEGTIGHNGKTLDAYIGDFHYAVTRRSGKSSSTHHYYLSFALVNLPITVREPIMIRPEGFFDKISGALGFDDIDFESEEFSRKYHISSSDRKFTYALIDPQMMTFLLDQHPPQIYLAQNWCYIWTEKLWEPQEFDPHLAWIKKFYDRWPRHLLVE